MTAQQRRRKGSKAGTTGHATNSSRAAQQHDVPQAGSSTTLVAAAAVLLCAAAWATDSFGWTRLSSGDHDNLTSWRGPGADWLNPRSAKQQREHMLAIEHWVQETGSADGPAVMTLSGPKAPTASDTDRVSALIDAVAAPGAPWDMETGVAIAKALNLPKLMRDIVERTPGATLVAHNPPIIRFENFLSKQECEDMISAGHRAGLRTSGLDSGRNDTWKGGQRTSRTAWCIGDDPVCTKIDSRIANTTCDI